VRQSKRLYFVIANYSHKKERFLSVSTTKEHQTENACPPQAHEIFNMCPSKVMCASNTDWNQPLCYPCVLSLLKETHHHRMVQ